MSRPEADDRIDIDVCCDPFLEAIECGALQVVDVGTGNHRVVVADRDGENGFALNFCPFCGGPRPAAELAVTQG